MNGITVVTIDKQAHIDELNALQAEYELALADSHPRFAPVLQTIFHYRVVMIRALAETGTAQLYELATALIEAGKFQWSLWQKAGAGFVNDARRIGAQVE